MSTEVKEMKKNNIQDLSQEIDYSTLYGKGGTFIVSPLDKSKVFSKEMFSEEQQMFANAALEYATTRMKPLKKELNLLIK